jgi:hypothetical protein
MDLKTYNNGETIQDCIKRVETYDLNILPNFIKNKSGYFKALKSFNELNDKNEPQNCETTTDIAIDKNMLDFIQYKKYKSIKINHTFEFNLKLVVDTSFNPNWYIKFNSLSFDDKMAIIYCFHARPALLDYYGYFSEDRYITLEEREVWVNTKIKYDIYHIDFISFNGENKIYITDKLLSNGEFTKIFFVVLVSELNHSLILLYKNLKSQYLNTYVYLKLIAQILKTYNYFGYTIPDFDLNVLCSDILADEYWPDDNISEDNIKKLLELTESLDTFVNLEYKLKIPRSLKLNITRWTKIKYNVTCKEQCEKYIQLKDLFNYIYDLNSAKNTITDPKLVDLDGCKSLCHDGKRCGLSINDNNYCTMHNDDYYEPLIYNKSFICDLYNKAGIQVKPEDLTCEKNFFNLQVASAFNKKFKRLGLATVGFRSVYNNDYVTKPFENVHPSIRLPESIIRKNFEDEQYLPYKISTLSGETDIIVYEPEYDDSRGWGYLSDHKKVPYNTNPNSSSRYAYKC